MSADALEPDALEAGADDRLALADLLNHVLDKGIVISGDVTISVADIDLIRVQLGLLISSVETELGRGAATDPVPDAGLPVLRDSGGR